MPTPLKPLACGDDRHPTWKQPSRRFRDRSDADSARHRLGSTLIRSGSSGWRAIGQDRGVQDRDTPDETSFYEAVGGSPTFRALVSR
ncbi:MAG TPA: hypothetical protein VIS06_02980, partial [Mycobacteriales bacterium]